MHLTHEEQEWHNAEACTLYYKNPADVSAICKPSSGCVVNQRCTTQHA